MNASILSATSPISSKYWSELKGLSNSVKLELITLLSSSILSTETEESEDKGWTESFGGKWQDDRSDDEILADIRSNRKDFIRNIEL